MIVISGNQILKAHADYLREFWSAYGCSEGDRRRRVSPNDWEDTIAALQRAGEFKIVYVNPKLTHTRRRQEFDKLKNKRMKYRFKKGDQCLACGRPPDVRHHIVWLINGGRNNRRNICFLCNDCHAEVHPWLKNK